jgi:dihydroorotase
VEKDVEFEQAAFGMTGLETALPLCLEFVRNKVLTPAALVRLLSTAPAAVLKLPGGSLAAGGVADVTVIAPDVAWTCEPARFRSRSRNSPFAGTAMKGRAVLTLVGGRIAHAEESFVA